MGILWYACTAPLWAMPLWSWMDQSPSYRVDCSVTEVFPDGGKTPLGRFTIVLQEGDKTGVQKGWTPLAGTWMGGPNLSADIKALNQGKGKFPLDVNIFNSIELPERPDGSGGRRGCGAGAEVRDDFVMQLPKADDSKGRTSLNSIGKAPAGIRYCCHDYL